MKRLLLSLATAVALLTTSVAANADPTLAFYYDKDNKRVCLVPTPEFTNARVYWGAQKASGKCDGPIPLGGMMNIRSPRELGAKLWRNAQQAAANMGVDTNFTYLYCRQYQGNGTKIRWNFVVRDSTGEDVSSGWYPDAGTKCGSYAVPMSH